MSAVDAAWQEVDARMALGGLLGTFDWHHGMHPRLLAERAFRAGYAAAQQNTQPNEGEPS